MGLWKLIIPELRVLVLTKRHVGSGNEIERIHKPTLEKSDSLGTKSRRKRLWDYLGGRRSNKQEVFSAECHSVDWF